MKIVFWVLFFLFLFSLFVTANALQQGGDSVIAIIVTVPVVILSGLGNFILSFLIRRKEKKLFPDIKGYFYFWPISTIVLVTTALIAARWYW